MEIKIYLITNRINGKKYVGQTSKTIEQRFKEHANCRKTVIGQAIRKYGRENFTIELLEECKTAEQANEREQYWIAFHDCIAPNGYNRNSGGSNYTASQETRRRLSESHKGKCPSQETRAKMAASRKGQRRSEETKAKQSASLKKHYKEHPVSQEKREKLSRSHKGQKPSPETIAKRVAKQKGRKLTPEHRAKLSAAKKGKHFSLETRKRMSESAKRRAQKPHD